SHLLCLLLMPPPSPLFPYTTLFRSLGKPATAVILPRDGGRTPPSRPSLAVAGTSARLAHDLQARDRASQRDLGPGEVDVRRPPRSEEHTSELQSRENLVCRLLLEKK